MFIHACRHESTSGEGGGTNITSAYIDDIPGTGVKKNSLASPRLHL